MELIIFVVLMVVGHMLMMFLMPGMHEGHNHKGHDHTGDAEDKKRLEDEIQQLRKELSDMKARLNQSE
ncbi:adhesion protein [Streptococcus suis]|nr:adhesion protein [Streptococcus suis]